MKRKINLSLAIGLGVAILGSVYMRAADKSPATDSAFERFIALKGEWVGNGPHGDGKHEDVVSYRVTSGGSAVVETIDPGGDHEMITVIHPDGDALMLTHYCMLGNQPQMKAQPKADDKTVAFEFIKATNLKSDDDMYMRSVTYTFVDENTLKAEWTHYNKGKDAGKATFELKRKK